MGSLYELGQLFDRFQSGGVVRLVGNFAHKLAVSQGAVGGDHKDRAGQQIQLLDQDAIGLAKGASASAAC